MRYIHQDHWADGNGRVIQGGTVTVYLSGTTTLATIYDSATATTALAGSTVTTAIDGLYTFYWSNFDYNYDQEFKLVFSKSNYVTSTYDKVAVRTPVLQTYAIDTNTTVTTRLRDIPEGVIYSPSTGVTLTFTKKISAGRYQIFSGAGTVAGLTETYPEWFGAVIDDSTVDSGAAWNSAITATKRRGTILPQIGAYYCSTGILVDENPVAILGDSTYGTVFAPRAGLASWTALMTVNSTVRGTTPNWWTTAHNNGFVMKGITFEGGGRDYYCHGLVFTGKNSDAQLSDIFFSNIKGSGMKACDPFGTTYDDATTGNLMQQCQFHNIRFQNCGYEATGGTASANFAASHAAYEIGRNAVGTGSHNHLKHTGAFQMGYSRWRGIRVLNRAGAGETGANIHELTWQDFFLHGTVSLSGNDENGDAWNTTEHLMTIGNIVADGESSTDTNYNQGEIKTVKIDRFHIVEMEPSYAGIVVGGCWDGAGADVGASIHLDHGQFGASSYLTPSYGVMFDGAESSYVGGITYHSPGGPANSVYVKSLLDTLQEITLGPLSAEVPTGTPDASATVYVKSDIGFGQIHDLTAQTFTARVDATLAAGAVTEFTVARNTPDYRFIKSAWIVPDATLTANDTDYATVSIGYRTNTGAHGTGSPVTTTTKTTGTGDWDAFEAVELNCDRGVAYLSIDGAVTLEITKAGAGVVTPALLFGFETSDWKYFQDP